MFYPGLGEFECEVLKYVLIQVMQSHFYITALQDSFGAAAQLDPDKNFYLIISFCP